MLSSSRRILEREKRDAQHWVHAKTGARAPHFAASWRRVRRHDRDYTTILVKERSADDRGAGRGDMRCPSSACIWCNPRREVRAHDVRCRSWSYWRLRMPWCGEALERWSGRLVPAFKLVAPPQTKASVALGRLHQIAGQPLAQQCSRFAHAEDRGEVDRSAGRLLGRTALRRAPEPVAQRLEAVRFADGVDFVLDRFGVSDVGRQRIEAAGSGLRTPRAPYRWRRGSASSASRSHRSRRCA